MLSNNILNWILQIFGSSVWILNDHLFCFGSLFFLAVSDAEIQSEARFKQTHARTTVLHDLNTQNYYSPTVNPSPSVCVHLL